MNGASWSSWQSAAELPDRDDDGPFPGFWAAEDPDCPGVFNVRFRSVARRTEGLWRRVKTGLSRNLATAIATDLDSRYQERLYQRLKALVEAEDAREASAQAALDANRAAMDAADAAMLADLDNSPVCSWCGAMVPIGVSVCGPCLATYPDDMDGGPSLSDAIPW